MNYGKLNNTVNLMTIQYNQFGLINSDEMILTERGFINFYGFPVAESSYGDDTKDQYNNLLETLTIEIFNRKNSMIQYKRNIFNDLEIPNLGLQPNNDCIFTLRYNRKDGKIELGYVDCKKTYDLSFRLKLEVLRKEGYYLQKIPQGRSIFGCNLYLIASDQKDIALTQMEKNAIIHFIAVMALENPQFFVDYQSSPEFIEFQNTGKFNALASSIYPFPKGITNFDFRKYLRTVDTDNEKDYNKILKELDDKDTGRSSDLIFDETNDDN